MILIINDFYVQGGAEVQVKLEIEMLNSLNIKSFLITLDPHFKTSLVNSQHFNYQRSSSTIGKYLNKFFLNYKAYWAFKKVLKNQKITAVHLHNNLKMTKTIYKLIKKYRIIHTLHDYGYICPRGTAIKADFSEYQGYFVSKLDGPKSLKDYVKIAELKRNRKLILKYDSLEIAPSKDLTNKVNLNGYKCQHIPNLISNKLLIDQKAVKKDQALLYFGVVSKLKGVDRLIKAFNKLNKGGLKLLIAGKVEKDFQMEFTSLIKENENITYYGVLGHAEVLGLLRKAVLVVVPSLWMENYPNVILESILNDTLCIGSNRGGIKEMLLDNQHLLFNVLDIFDMINKINYCLSLSPSEYDSLVKKLKDNLLSIHDVDKLKEQYQKLLEEK